MSTSSVNDQPETNAEGKTYASVEVRPKGMVQKVCLWSAYVCFFMGAVCGVFLYLKTQELNASDPVIASFLASLFFFVFTGVSLFLMAKANLPNLGFHKPVSKAK